MDFTNISTGPGNQKSMRTMEIYNKFNKFQKISVITTFKPPCIVIDHSSDKIYIIKNIQMPLFLLQKEINYGQCVYIVHSLNNWSLRYSLRLKWNKSHQWKGFINSKESFEYKFVIASYDDPTVGTIWERGKNRKFKKEAPHYQVEFWEQRRIKLTLLARQKQRSLIMVTGSCGSLGSPLKMQKSKTQDQQTCFTVSFMASIDEINRGIDYQYYILCPDQFGDGYMELISESHQLPKHPSEQEMWCY